MYEKDLISVANEANNLIFYALMGIYSNEVENNDQYYSGYLLNLISDVNESTKGGEISVIEDLAHRHSIISIVGGYRDHIYNIFNEGHENLCAVHSDLYSETEYLYCGEESYDKWASIIYGFYEDTVMTDLIHGLKLKTKLPFTVEELPFHAINPFFAAHHLGLLTDEEYFDAAREILYFSHREHSKSVNVLKTISEDRHEAELGLAAYYQEFMLELAAAFDSKFGSTDPAGEAIDEVARFDIDAFGQDDFYSLHMIGVSGLIERS